MANPPRTLTIAQRLLNVYRILVASLPNNNQPQVNNQDGNNVQLSAARAWLCAAECPAYTG
jgi:hypothetical protein